MATMTAQPKNNTATTKASQTPAQANKTGPAEYIKGVKAEWHKISWPTKIQLWQMTLTVLVMVFFLTTLIWAIDNVLHYGISLIVPKPPGSP